MSIEMVATLAGVGLIVLLVVLAIVVEWRKPADEETLFGVTMFTLGVAGATALGVLILLSRAGF